MNAKTLLLLRACRDAALQPRQLGPSPAAADHPLRLLLLTGGSLPGAAGGPDPAAAGRAAGPGSGSPSRPD